MREFLKRHRVAISSFLALVVPLFLLYVHGRSPRKTTIVEVALLRLTAPVEAAAADAMAGVKSVWSRYVALVDLAEENARLAKDVEILTAEALAAKELRHENARLRDLLQFKRERQDLETIAAHIIGQDVSPFARVVRVSIDAGSSDGVEEGMPVVSAQGLVGRIKVVSGRYAEVMLAVDARSSINVRVAGKGVSGNLEGTGANDEYSARLLYLQKAEPLVVGDTVVTSGHDKVFPPGLEVGYIRSLEERQRGVYYELQVAPAVNFSILEEVAIVIGHSDADEAEAPAPGKGGER
ncbi:MAG: rod shape-determining protein MreC [Deltaproteobacteria bacterium]|nr:rod shape-determining protein MreC [Deltaproteobacteria bacterium]MCB9788182.1 rod shape-determining protein MreC [Deltaproteobacteria bacterium]